MEAWTFLAPAHNPPYVAAMRAFRSVAPTVSLVALFETAFFDRPRGRGDDLRPARRVAGRSHFVRRYGFHGASHRFASERALALCPKKGLRHISCHLGGSSSLAAVRDGVAIDTSFGMSPQSGLPQNNRAGDVDAFAVLHMMKTLSLDADGMARVLASQSGLAGLSGTSGEVPDLERAAAAGDARARLALDVFVRSVRHYIGAFLRRAGRARRPDVLRRNRRAGQDGSGRASAPGSSPSGSGSTRPRTR